MLMAVPAALCTAGEAGCAPHGGAFFQLCTGCTWVGVACPNVCWLVVDSLSTNAHCHCRRVVIRADCTRGCKGPLLATSKRLSGLGKRSLDSAGRAKSADSAQTTAAKVGAV